jgi:hypothetical protein
LNTTQERLAVGGELNRWKSTQLRIALIGDSVGSCYAAKLEAWAKSQGIGLSVLSIAGSSPIPPSTHFTKAMDFLERENPDVVIAACAWSNMQDRYESIRVALESLSKSSGYVLVLGQPPILTASTSRETYRLNGYSADLEQNSSIDARKRFGDLVTRLGLPNTSWIDVAPCFLEGRDKILFRDDDHRQLFQDSLHPSSHGAELVIKKVLGPMILSLSSPGTPVRISHDE